MASFLLAISEPPEAPRSNTAAKGLGGRLLAAEIARYQAPDVFRKGYSQVCGAPPCTALDLGFQRNLRP